MWGRIVLTVLLALTPILVLAKSTMIVIPAGSFWMGSSLDELKAQHEDGEKNDAFLNQVPLHQRHVDVFEIDQYEVSNRDYKNYIDSHHASLPTYWIDNGYALSLKSQALFQLTIEDLRQIAAEVIRLDVDTRQLDRAELQKQINNYWRELDELPVVTVTWYEANTYCKALNKRLPSEAEWEKAARGPQANLFPWGNQWQPGYANVQNETWLYGVAPIGRHFKDRSFYGVMDMGGNAFEWVEDWYQPYPNNSNADARYGQRYKVVRGWGNGGSGHYDKIIYQRSSHRLLLLPGEKRQAQGFRCARSITQ
ncbi:MAG: formylglycine-generating enzyme family protein [Gammaproteobacteria bacterium]|nr:formylglycine-generating enzyme family protein [Gammaproteobacteria bacterium]